MEGETAIIYTILVHPEWLNVVSHARWKQINAAASKNFLLYILRIGIEYNSLFTHEFMFYLPLESSQVPGISKILIIALSTNIWSISEGIR